MGIKRQVPVDDPVTSIEFALTDGRYPFVAASTDGGQVELEEIIPRGTAGYAEFFTVTDADPDDVLALAAAHDSVEAQVLARYRTGGLFEFVVSDDCPAVFLGEQGALPRRVESLDGEARIAAEVPPAEDPTAIVDRFLSAYPDAELVNKRKQPYVTLLFGHREFRSVIESHLTARQLEVLSAADEAGFYDWPRETSGEALAESLGITPSTLHQHLRAAERKLVEVFLNRP